MMYTSKLIDKWHDYQFESSTRNTADFKQFARDYKSWVSNVTRDKFMLASYTTGHFHIHGFLKHIKTGKYIYFSIADVRFFKNECLNNILIRAAKDNLDYSGGNNTFTKVYQFVYDCETLVK